MYSTTNKQYSRVSRGHDYGNQHDKMRAGGLVVQVAWGCREMPTNISFEYLFAFVPVSLPTSLPPFHLYLPLCLPLSMPDMRSP